MRYSFDIKDAQAALNETEYQILDSLLTKIEEHVQVQEAEAERAELVNMVKHPIIQALLGKKVDGFEVESIYVVPLNASDFQLPIDLKQFQQNKK